MSAGALDVAIIGGGVAGTYAAHRLSRERPHWHVRVFERSPRVGGRLLSLPPRRGDVAAELDGCASGRASPWCARSFASWTSRCGRSGRCTTTTGSSCAAPAGRRATRDAPGRSTGSAPATPLSHPPSSWWRRSSGWCRERPPWAPRTGPAPAKNCGCTGARCATGPSKRRWRPSSARKVTSTCSTASGTPRCWPAYGDGWNRDHWAELAEPPTRLDDLAYGDTGRWGAYAASAGQVEEACRHLALLHDTVVPAPEASAFVDWGDDGAWHVWDPGVDPVGVMDRLTRPDPEIPLYTCGEAYSLSQGWVEAALESTERALERLLA